MAGSKNAPSREPSWQALERALSVRFKERSLLRQAMVHRSFLNEHPELEWESYERLEYLGDAFLGWMAAEELYARCPGFTEGELTRARASLVQGRTLAEIAREIGLGTYLYLGQGEETSGGRARRSNLAAALEAVIGAVLLDRGAITARKLVLRFLDARIDGLAREGVPRDAKSELQERAQRLGQELPRYEALEESGDAHSRRFRIRVLVNGQAAGEGAGPRKAEAEQAAAAQALSALP